MSKAKNKEPTECALGTLGPAAPYVNVRDRKGNPWYFFPWDVVAIEPGTEPGRGWVHLARDGAMMKVPYENMDPPAIAAEVWAGIQRGAATTLLNQVHAQGMQDVIEGVVGLAEPGMRQWLGDARSDEIKAMVVTQVREALLALAAKRAGAAPQVTGGS